MCDDGRCCHACVSNLQLCQSHSKNCCHARMPCVLRTCVSCAVRAVRAVHVCAARSGVKLYTLSGKTLTASRSSDGARIKLTGPSNSGWIYETDMEACKGYVQAIDTVLLP